MLHNKGVPALAHGTHCPWVLDPTTHLSQLCKSLQLGLGLHDQHLLGLGHGLEVGLGQVPALPYLSSGLGGQGHMLLQRRSQRLALGAEGRESSLLGGEQALDTWLGAMSRAGECRARG